MNTGLSYEVRVLHAAADGIGPALILSAPKGAAQYLVNVPEGFARLALEHKLRPSARLSCVMLTSLLPQSAVRISAPSNLYLISLALAWTCAHHVMETPSNPTPISSENIQIKSLIVA